MAVFKFVISSPESRRSYQLEVDQGKCSGIIGKKIGDDFSGDIIGLKGYSLQITGGTDKDGFPMHPRLKGPGRRKMLLKAPPGFHPRLKGQRKKKIVRGNTISEAISQINVKVVKKGAEPLEKLIPKKPKKAKEKVEEKVEEKKAVEEKKEEKPAEEKPKEVPKEAEEKIKPEKEKAEEKKEIKPKEEKPKKEIKPEVRKEKIEEKAGGEKGKEEVKS